MASKCSQLLRVAAIRNAFVPPARFAAKKSNDQLTPEEKIKCLQYRFQRDDGLPVWLKGGPNDKYLYQATLGLCALGLLMNFHLYFGYIL
ncbi:cytochrome c oxidase subunit 7A1, mitochondrial-like [Teleopsis dalmanni]|uniref:cytochrome c oxidase subunit 7A1, mitochondrial-like n=1 Tax=Teleopsis dalmanni TaxID=139649 RepID=UPI000D32D284|nr:cytochrome c oxidase subunit 7A1, mitochondrial-like [Teleopsis dalmanni]